MITLKQNKQTKEELVPLYIWLLKHDPEYREFIEKEYKRISQDPTRICAIVEDQTRQFITLYVNDLTKKV